MSRTTASAHERSTATPSPDRTKPSTLRIAVARTILETRIYFRERDSVVFSFLFPVVLLGLFATVFGGGETVFGEATGGGVDFARYFLPGMVAAGIMLVSFQTLAIGIAVERDEGTLKRLRGTPMPPAAYFLGKVGMVLLTGLAQVALLLAVAAVAFDVPLPGDAGSWLRFAWVYLLGTAAGTVLGLAYSSVPSSARSASAVVLAPVLILQFISGVFFVFNDLPSWLQNVASVFPLKWLAQGMRSVFLPDRLEPMEVSGSWQLAPTALILSVWLVAGLLLCARTFRWGRKGDS
ncbi:ABC-2 type transport system permease protein [Haloactinopolyspora alba]|uniref:ABC-2 type transport system permease protein n=1 Tax=Haloactinopolyspora alba TaxID=648780 RepID=A0A2P8EB82_9ACTN|nr:ABC transporter permease [Haloactinopolyspora alba]PSL06722.1 ABC-2 type transport system permease protein [Haloactinopolyspora alba]